MPRIPWRTPPWNERNARPPCLRCGEYREDQPIPNLPIDADDISIMQWEKATHRAGVIFKITGAEHLLKHTRQITYFL